MRRLQRQRDACRVVQYQNGDMVNSFDQPGLSNVRVTTSRAWVAPTVVTICVESA